MNTSKDTPGGFVGGSGDFSSSNASAPGPSRKRPFPALLPIDMNTIGSRKNTKSARKIVAHEENETSKAAASPRRTQLTKPLVSTSPSELQSDAPVTENNEGKSSRSSKEKVFHTSTRKSRSFVDSDGYSSSSEEENFHCPTGYFKGTQRIRREARAAGRTGKQLPRSTVIQCPKTFAWLEANFEKDSGSAVPRQLVYDQYVVMCEKQNLKPVNSASFGKMIRIMFPEIKTRRLGIRGHSKYHYDGVYYKQGSYMHPRSTTA